MKSLFKALLAILVLAAPARADNFGADLSFTAPSAPGTNIVYTLPTEIGMYTTCSFYNRVQGVTGGTLDITIQTAFRGVNTTPVWADMAHLPQLAAGAALTASAFTVTRFSSTASTIVTSLNTTNNTPALPVNTVVNGFFGMKFRIIAVTGAGTSAGTLQTLLVYCSST